MTTNSYGAKLANIFSHEFIVETSDSTTGQQYKQVFSNNMSTIGKPVIKKASGSDYTCITFKPDLNRFKMNCFDDDTVALLCKRVFDIAGTSVSGGAKLKVYLNGERLPVKSFQEYIALYDGIEAPSCWEKVNERWEIGVGMSDGQFTQVSFVNSICTTKGGQHANYVADKVIAKLAGVVKKKNKGEEVKAHFIKNHLCVYVNCLVENPAFDSQTKETLTTRPNAFGSDVVLSDKFLKAVEKSGVVDRILSWAKFKQNEQLKRKGGVKKTKLSGITKLDGNNNLHRYVFQCALFHALSPSFLFCNSVLSLSLTQHNTTPPFFLICHNSQ
jgi:DNA topoisomerase II